jgi:hypothetical protein
VGPGSEEEKEGSEKEIKNENTNNGGWWFGWRGGLGNPGVAGFQGGALGGVLGMSDVVAVV